jgi:proteasome accessory factor C
VRDVEGTSVFLNLGNWYLTGYCHLAEASRVFRVDRIVSVEVLDDAYEMRDERGDGIIRYRPSDTDVHVTFTVGPDTRWVSEYYPVDAEDLEDGGQEITMSVSDPLVAARLLVRLGDAASHVTGDEVIEAMDALRDRIRTRYARTP